MINENSKKKMKITSNYTSMNDRNRKEIVRFYYKNIDKDSCFLFTLEMVQKEVVCTACVQ